MQRGGEPSRPEGQADVPAAEKGLDGTTNRAFEPLGVCALDADDDLAQRKNVLKVDEAGGHAHPLGIVEQATKQSRLPVTAGTEQSKRMTSFGESQQIPHLGLSVDHLLWRKRPRKAKRIDHDPSERSTLTC